MDYNIVTNHKIVQVFKKSKHFVVNLGYSSTTETNTGDRILNKKDDFAFFYNTTYKGATILAHGKIGNISIYSDPYIFEDKIAFYYNKEEFIFDFDQKMVDEKGVDFYLGHLIKTINEKYQERIKQEEERKEQQKKTVGSSDKVFANPGNVTYADLKAYMDRKSAERLKS